MKFARYIESLQRDCPPEWRGRFLKCACCRCCAAATATLQLDLLGCVAGAAPASAPQTPLPMLLSGAADSQVPPRHVPTGTRS